MTTRCCVYINNVCLQRRRTRTIRLNAIGLSVALGLSVFARSGGADTVNWTGGGSGNWDVAANWTDTTTNTNVVPDSTDDVGILNALVSLVNSSFTIQDLTLGGSGLSNGTLTILGNTTLTGANSFTNATINANGSFTQTGGSLLLNGGTLTTATLSMNNGALLDLYNNPTLNMTTIVFGNTGGDTTPGSLQLEGNAGNPSPYTIGSGTTLTGNLGAIGTAAQIDGNNSQLINNGTITLNTSGLTTTIGGGNLNSVTNAGTITVTNGNTAALSNVGLINSNTGTVTVGNNGTLALSGSTLTNDGTFTIGAGASFRSPAIAR